MSRKVKDKKNYRMYNQTLFVVEQVVQMKWVKNRQFCLIKWRGYDQKFNTWEPKDHITYCYNYEAASEKDDDPEYFQKVPICNPTPHNYQTRTRTRKKPSSDFIAKIAEAEEKQDHTQLVELQEGLSNLKLFPIQKPMKETNKEAFEIRKKGETQSVVASKEDLVSRVLQFVSEKNTQRRRGKVETIDGRIIYLSEDVLKARYPEKVIEYYEEKMRSKTMKYD